jgi:hypothetical protein
MQLSRQNRQKRPPKVTQLRNKQTDTIMAMITTTLEERHTMDPSTPQLTFVRCIALEAAAINPESVRPVEWIMWRTPMPPDKNLLRQKKLPRRRIMGKRLL